MRGTQRRAAPVVAAIAAVAATGAVALASIIQVGGANDKVPGMVRANALTPTWRLVFVADGADKLDGGTSAMGYYGYAGTGPHVPAPGSTTEAPKTDPGKNTYLVLSGQHGASASYDYGTHFLYQGHEAGAPGAITRINLDADPAHAVTLLATRDTSGAPLPDLSGSAWNPFAQRLLLTSTAGAGGVFQATPDYPARVTDVSSVLGRAHYSSIKLDSQGNLYLFEDTPGRSGSAAAGLQDAHQPNSFVYRFKPANPANLAAGGQLQALQVLDASGRPIVFGGTTQAAADADIDSAQNHAMRTYGKTFQTRWVNLTLPASLDANAAAKAASATPFKRSTDGAFQSQMGFTDLLFVEKGDTAVLPATEAAHDAGGYGGILRLTQSPSSNTGSLTLFYAGDVVHTGFDDIMFLASHLFSAAEDRGDAMHSQNGVLDSGWRLDARIDYGAPGAIKPVRWLAAGQDASAAIDTRLPGVTSADNEITGVLTSDGDPTPQGILGVKATRFVGNGWRFFWTQQHGDNTTWLVTSTGAVFQ